MGCVKELDAVMHTDRMKAVLAVVIMVEVVMGALTGIGCEGRFACPSATAEMAAPHVIVACAKAAMMIIIFQTAQTNAFQNYHREAPVLLAMNAPAE